MNVDVKDLHKIAGKFSLFVKQLFFRLHRGFSSDSNELNKNKLKTDNKTLGKLTPQVFA